VEPLISPNCQDRGHVLTRWINPIQHRSDARLTKPRTIGASLWQLFAKLGGRLILSKKCRTRLCVLPQG
jgi:hypothetical protein